MNKYDYILIILYKKKDEPCLNQSKKSKLDLQIKEFIKKKNQDSNYVVHSIENADKNPKEILAWINDVNEIHKRKQPPSVIYSKPFPEIEQLMQVNKIII